jgi:hypothetical protein
VREHVQIKNYTDIGGDLMDMGRSYTDIGELNRHACRSIQSYASHSMKRASQLLLWSGMALLSWPLDAHAQRIPDIVVVLAAMPLLAAILALALGIVMKSWLVGAGNFALVGLWVAWFAAAAKYSESDLMNWAPIGVLGLHLAAMGVLIAVRAVRHRVRVDDA